MANSIFLTIGIVLVVFIALGVVPQLIKNYRSWPGRLRRLNYNWFETSDGVRKMNKMVQEAVRWDMCAAGEIFGLPRHNVRPILENRYGEANAERIIDLGVTFTAQVQGMLDTRCKDVFEAQRKRAIEVYYEMRYLKNKFDEEDIKAENWLK